MTSTDPETFPDLIAAMKLASAALRDADVPHLLGGGLAAWARGGPPTGHDVDFFVREADAERALQALVDAGMTAERPPEGWLLKAWCGETLIDLIFHPAGGPVGDEHFERAELLEVMAQPLAVASLDDVMAMKLLSLTEQEPNFGSVLELARSLREQIDWSGVRERTRSSPFARAFFTLVEELGIVELPRPQK
ncbi:MAG: nucleotidyltransferase family protein [Gaiellaceae bacterium MAG52_C11]|nr:nucleotidyltransferase family protein [Candidatus Gaiellasilicea maunaloa]